MYQLARRNRASQLGFGLLLIFLWIITRKYWTDDADDQHHIQSNAHPMHIHANTKSMVANTATSVVSNETKFILQWNDQLKHGTSADVHHSQMQEGKESFKTCKVNDCFITHNRSHFASPDKFHLIQFNYWETWPSDLPAKRSPNQIYLFYAREPPTYPLEFDR